MRRNPSYHRIHFCQPSTSIFTSNMTETHSCTQPTTVEVLRIHPNYNNNFTGSNRWMQLSHLQQLNRSEVEHNQGRSS